MSLHLALLIIYSCTVVGVGLWTARFVRTSSAFFVAGRSLGPGLIDEKMRPGPRLRPATKKSLLPRT